MHKALSIEISVLREMIELHSPVRIFSAWFAVLLLFALPGGCGQQAVDSNLSDATQRSSPEYAEGFNYATLSGLPCIEILDMESADRDVKCTVCKGEKNEVPDGAIAIPDAPLIVTLSTTHVSLFIAANALDNVVGTSYADRILHSAGQAAIAEGTLKNLSGEKDLDTEKVLALGPDLLISYPFGAQDYKHLTDRGIDVLPFSEYLETHPLGRAEWMKVAGFIAGTEEAANDAFNKVKSEYLSLRDSALKHADSRPKVYTGSKSDGRWYAPPANSFMGQFTRDAAGSYLFEDKVQEGNLSMDFEQFLQRAGESDFWGRVVFVPGALSYADIVEEDPRYASLPPIQKQQVFYCNAAETDYFGEAIVAPHHVLADLIALLHPELLPDHEAHYFQSVAH